MADSTIQRKLTAEVIGTFVLVLFGCGSVVVYSTSQIANDGRLLPSTVTTVGLTFGLAIVVMVYAFGRVSGGHFNPAVSVGAGISGRMAWSQVGLYALAQIIGAVLGALVLFLLMQGYESFDAEGNMGQNTFGDVGTGYAWWAAFLLELVLTAIFVTVILAVTDERNEHPAMAPLAIGLTLAAIHFVAIPATGTSVNPARSIGPALFAGADAIEQLWLFILAPLIGGAIAGIGYPLLFGRASEAVPGSGISFARPRTAAQAPGLGAPDQYQQQWNQEDPRYGAGAQAAATGGAAAGAGTAGTGVLDTGAAGTGAAATGSDATAEPIIQDGWQWDPVGQQWHPVGSTPEQWRAQQEAEAAEAERAAQAGQGQADAGYSDSGYPDAGYSGSGYSDSGYSEPAQQEPRHAEPGYTDPGYADPAQPGTDQPGMGQPGTDQPGTDNPDDGTDTTQVRPPS